MPIEYDKQGKVVIITMNRPDAMNCLNLEDMDALGQAWINFRDDNDLLVAIITGSGDQSFSTGADLLELIPKITPV